MGPSGFLAPELDTCSVRLNPLLAELLQRISFIEKAGTGIRRIRDESRAQGCPEQTFEVSGFFTAIFPPNPEVRAQAEAQESGQATQQVGTKSAPSRDPGQMSGGSAACHIACGDRPIGLHQVQEPSARPVAHRGAPGNDPSRQVA